MQRQGHGRGERYISLRYAYTHVYIYTYTCAHIHVGTIHTHTQTYIDKNLYKNRHMGTHKHLPTNTHTYTHIEVPTYTHTLPHRYIYTYTHMHTCVCTCINILMSPAPWLPLSIAPSTGCSPLSHRNQSIAAGRKPLEQQRRRMQSHRCGNAYSPKTYV